MTTFFLSVILEGARRAHPGDPLFTAFAVVASPLDSQPSAENDVMVRGSASLIAYQAIHRDFELFAGAELL